MKRGNITRSILHVGASTVHPLYNTMFGVHTNGPSYKGTMVNFL